MNSPRLRTAYSPLFAWEDCTFVNQFVTRSGVGHPDNFFLEGACAGQRTLTIGAGRSPTLVVASFTRMSFLGRSCVYLRSTALFGVAGGITTTQCIFHTDRRCL